MKGFHGCVAGRWVTACLLVSWCGLGSLKANDDPQNAQSFEQLGEPADQDESSFPVGEFPDDPVVPEGQAPLEGQVPLDGQVPPVGQAGRDGGFFPPQVPDTQVPDAQVPMEDRPAEFRAEPQAGGFVEPRPGEPLRVGGWYLGVYGQYTSTGLLLTEVFPRTAASQAGLEVGDRLVAVNGRQIGNVLGYRLPLDEALQRYASPQGWVRLLVQDRRTLRLVNIDVRLTRTRIHT